MPDSLRAFTLIELLVVISIIVIVLLIALPGLNAMSADMRKNAAAQQIETVLSRAQNLAIEKSTLTAVRFLPAAWDAATDAAAADKQRMVVYEYGGATERWDESSGSFLIEFNEFFRRAPALAAVDLPEGTWVAPLESLTVGPPNPPSSEFTVRTQKYGYSASTAVTVYNSAGVGRSLILRGPTGVFAYDPIDPDGNSYFEPDNALSLNADDFLVVFDPRTGLVAGSLRTWRVLSTKPKRDPDQGQDSPLETDGGFEYYPSSDSYGGEFNYFQRLAFGGLIIYPREQFVGAAIAGNDAGTALARQKVLADAGLHYAITRFGGQLTDAGGAAP